MPKWKPGKQNGKPMRVQYNLPVVFDKKHCIPLFEGQEQVTGMPATESDYDVSPNAPTQQMERDGVKVIVR
jgi:hypothetical protein